MFNFVYIWRRDFCTAVWWPRAREEVREKEPLCVFVCAMSICKCHPFEFTTDLRASEVKRTRASLRERENSQTRTVTIVMVCNGLMTSSKDLQQLSCYSNCCCAEEAHIYNLRASERAPIRSLAHSSCIHLPHLFRLCYHGHWPFLILTTNIWSKTWMHDELGAKSARCTHNLRLPYCVVHLISWMHLPSSATNTTLAT